MPNRRNPFHGLRILIVEDEALIAEMLSDQLSREGCDVIARADTGAAAVEPCGWRRT